MRWKIALFAVAAAGLSGCVPVKPAVNTDFEASIAKAVGNRCFAVGPEIMSLPRHGYPFSMPLTEDNSPTGRMYGNTSQSRHLLDALVSAGLLSARDAQITDPMIPSRQVPGRTYSLTPTGRDFLQSPDSLGFCAAHLVFDHVIDFTVPGVNSEGETVSRVTGALKVIDIAPWVYAPSVTALNDPNMQFILRKDGHEFGAKETLMNYGWKSDIGATF